METRGIETERGEIESSDMGLTWKYRFPAPNSGTEGWMSLPAVGLTL